MILSFSAVTGVNSMIPQVTSSTYASPARRLGTGTATVETNNHVLIEITGPAGADEARRVSIELARQAAFDDGVAERAALIATEAAANILRYAGSGQLLARVVSEAEPAVEIIALDRGPGI